MWFFNIILYILFYQSVAYSKTNRPVEQKAKEVVSLIVDTVNYGGEKLYLEKGSHQKISCKGSHKFQKIEWYDPSGELVEHRPANRVFVQDYLLPSQKSRPQAFLVIGNALVKDTGLWTCKAGNLEETVALCVLEAAEFVSTPKDVTIDEGRSITLSCQARGDPDPTLQWYRNGELLSDDDNKIYTGTKYNHHGFEGLLTIKSVTVEDSGIYVCEALQEVPDTNCRHSDHTNITLNVNHAPQFNYGFNVSYIFATNNQSVELICAPTAYPTPVFRWFKEMEGQEILEKYSDKQFRVSDDGSQSDLSLFANSSTFDQTFRCQVDNEYGQAVHRFKILRMLRPAKINELTVVDRTGDSVEFNVTWYEDENIYLFPVEGFDIEYLKKNANGVPIEKHWRQAKKSYYVPPYHVMEINETVIVPLTNLDELTDYWVRIRAVNDLGNAPWSAPMPASTTDVVETTEPTSTDEDPNDNEEDEGEYDYGLFYGIFFAVAIVIVAALCIFIVQRV